MSTWEFRDADLRRHVVTFEHNRWSGWQTLTVDVREVAHERKAWEMGGDRAFDLDGHPAVLRIVKRGWEQTYTLLVDGQIVQERGTTLARPGEEPAVNPQAMDAFVRDLEVRRQIANGSGWLYWIAGASLVNAVLYHSGSSLGFPIGAVSGFLIEGIADGLQLPALALIGHLSVAGGFWLAGRRARRGSAVAFIVGGVLYLCDTLIVFALLQDVLFTIFHAIGLYGVFRGWGALARTRATAAVPATS